ncbi:Ig-like domain-containing protein [Paenibacillus sp. GYB003]|uniref:Ig-like domain-containing protein n=1 Tax=Paenibacillus sp. GYB003 TaxID=2994392 RepID=UPI002F964B69
MNLRLMKRAAITAATALIVSNWLPLAPLGNQTAHADPSQFPCGNRVALINGSFEDPDLLNPPSNSVRHDGVQWKTIYDDFVPGWETTDSSGSIEFASPTKLGIHPNINNKYHITDVPDGEQFVELNAYEFGQLYQDVQTIPGQTISWRLSHRAVYLNQVHGFDTMAVRIGSSTTDPSKLPVVETIKTHTSQGWVEYRGTYKVPESQTVTRFGFESVGSVAGAPNTGNFLDDIFLGTEPCGVVTKSVDPADNVQEADVLTYTVNFINDGGDETSNTLFTDLIPDGTEYIPGSLEIVSGPNSGKLTDAAGDDQGEFLASENRVVVRLGNGANGSQAGRIPNVDVLPDGTTVQFKVKILSKYKTTAVSNQATVEYDNLLSGDHETRKSNGVTVEVNRPPIAPNFEETTWKGTTATGSVYGVDANGDTLTFAQGTAPKNGTVTVNPDGTWRYTPDPNFVGEDTFTVIVEDGKGGTSTSTVTVNVKEPPNNPPVTKNYDVTTQKDTSVTGSVYGSDPDGDTLAYAIESDPKHGTVVVNSDGTWEYVPDPGYVGPDIFTVIVSDRNGGYTTSTITVDVKDKPNNPPVSSGKEVTTEKGTSVTGDVYGTDPDGDPLTYTPGKQPGNGTVIVNPDGSWKYTPDPNFVGEDSFTVIVDDGKGGKTEVEIIVVVTEPTTPPPTNQPPVSPDKEVTTDKGTSVTGDVYGTDPDGDPLTYTPGKQPGNGTVIVNPDGSWKYTPNPDFVGEDSFTVIVDDGKGNKTEVTVTVRVTEPSTPPTNPGDGTNPTDPGNGTNPTDPGNSTNPTNPGNGTNPTDPGNGTNPTDLGNGTNPTNPGNGTNPTDPGDDTDTGGPGDNSTSPPQSGGDSSSGENDGAQSPSDENVGGDSNVPVGAKGGNQLPNTSTNLFNLGLAGLIALCAGLVLMFRKRKA